MSKWMLISICNREIEPIKMYETCEEAQAAMKADFINTVGIEEYDEVCAANGEPYCDVWQLGEDDAWISGGDSIDWYVIPVAV